MITPYTNVYPEKKKVQTRKPDWPVKGMTDLQEMVLYTIRGNLDTIKNYCAGANSSYFQTKAGTFLCLKAIRTSELLAEISVMKYEVDTPSYTAKDIRDTTDIMINQLPDETKDVLNEATMKFREKIETELENTEQLLKNLLLECSYPSEDAEEVKKMAVQFLDSIRQIAVYGIILTDLREDITRQSIETQVNQELETVLEYFYR